MAEVDVIVAWGHGSVPESVRAAFQRPTRFLTLPNPNWKNPLEPFGGSLRALLGQYASGVIPLRVAALGFSASCQGVRAVLAAPDGGKNLDAAVAVDGIHTGLPVTPAAMTQWYNFAKLAVDNDRLLVVTHSSVVPPGYASTTQTADWLWDNAVYDPSTFAEPPVPDISIPPTNVHVAGGPATGPTRDVYYASAPAQPPRRARGLVVLGYDNLDSRGTADHIYQAKAVMPMVLVQFLARRWNEMDPRDMGAKCFVG